MLDPFSGRPARRENEPLYSEGKSLFTSADELLSFLAEHDGVQALEGLVDGDRLGMLPRAYQWLQKRCYLLDLRLLVYETLAKVVAAGPTLQASDDLGEWLEARLEVASSVLLEQDARLAADNVPIGEPMEPRFQFLMETLNFTPSEVRRAAVAANGLRTGERHVFVHCFVLGKGFARYADEVGIADKQAQNLLVRAIDKLSDAVGDL